MGLGGDELVAFWRRVYIVKSCLTKLEGTHKIKGGGQTFLIAHCTRKYLIMTPDIKSGTETELVENMW